MAYLMEYFMVYIGISWNTLGYTKVFYGGVKVPRKGFYISDELVLKKLSKVKNQSKYIEQLVLNDILQNGMDGDVLKNDIDMLHLLGRQVELLRLHIEK